MRRLALEPCSPSAASASGNVSMGAEGVFSLIINAFIEFLPSHMTHLTEVRERQRHDYAVPNTTSNEQGMIGVTWCDLECSECIQYA